MEQAEQYIRELTQGVTRFVFLNCCVVFSYFDDAIQVLLVKKDEGPLAGSWILPYGFVMPEEKMDDSARRILTEKTGIKNIFIEQVRTYSEGRIYNMQVMAVMYYALINKSDYDLHDQQLENTKWFPLAEVPQMKFSQDEMIRAAVVRMRYRTMEKPVGLRLLPSLFTIPQLHKLVEAIENKNRDKRNFRKIVDEAYYIEKTDKIDKLHSKRGAALYRFNQKLYDHYLKHKF
ncbi:MAG: NUDIX domain-containing protein [Bacteroidaceae bacterium]|nr:NUDIX domain-containing protein [Bacteroidaceae bacterium]